LRVCSLLDEATRSGDAIGGRNDLTHGKGERLGRVLLLLVVRDGGASIDSDGFGVISACHHRVLKRILVLISCFFILKGL
jgi:hypothetical protein